jgi:hypothetical protein
MAANGKNKQEQWQLVRGWRTYVKSCATSFPKRYWVEVG